MTNTTITRGDKVLLPRGRKPWTVTSVNEDGTLTLRRRKAERAYLATRRSYRGFGSDPTTEWQFNIDPRGVRRA